MKFFLSIFTTLLFFTTAQGQFFTENFEAAPSQYTPTCTNTSGSNDYFRRASDGDISANSGTDYSGEQGSFYWAAEDVDGGGTPCGNQQEQLIFNDINISGRTGVRISIMAAANGAGSSNIYEDEYIRVTYQIDNTGGFSNALWFSVFDSGGDDGLSLDPGFTGTGTSTALTATFQTFTFDLPSTGNLLDVTIEMRSNSSSEEMAVDLFQLIEIVLAPVELADFTADKKEGNVMLHWSTVTETNNEYFEIERSVDGQRFEAITQVPGAVNSIDFVHYEYLDKEVPTTRKVYYRLKQVDTDGEFAYSKIVSVENEASNPVTIAPNPVSADSKLYFSTELEEDVVLDIFNMDGKLVSSTILMAGHLEYELPREGLQAGIYFAKMQLGNEVQTVRFVN